MSGSAGKVKVPFFRSKIRREELLVTIQQLAVAVAAGVRLKTCLDRMAADCANLRLKEVLWDISLQLSAGKSLSFGMARHPDAFAPVEVQLVRTGEASGKLPEILRRIADDMESRDILNDKIRSALAYPLFVLGVALLLSAGLLAWGVPQVQGVYDSMGAQLPLPTQIMVIMGHALSDFWYLWALGGAAAVWGLPKLLRNPVVREGTDRLLARLPIISELLTMLNVAYFSRTLGMLYRSGLPLSQSLELLLKTVSNAQFRAVLTNLRERIEQGQTMSAALRSRGYFPSLGVEMVATGEETGSLDGMLDELNRLYTRRSSQAITRVTSLLEPALTVLIGILLGGIILGLGMPFLNMPALLL